MSKEVAKQGTSEVLSPTDMAYNKLGTYSKAVSSLLPSHIDPKRFMRLAITALSTNHDLAVCIQTEAGMNSFIISVLQAASFGLEVNSPLHEASLIPYGQIVQFQPEYRGLMRLAFNTGMISNIRNDVVYANDEFEYEETYEGPIFKHKKTEGERGAIHASWCIIEFINPDIKPHIEVMLKRDLDHVRASAKTKKVWDQHPGQMSRKSVIKRGLNYVPKSVEISRLIDISNKADAGAVPVIDDKISGLIEMPEPLNIDTEQPTTEPPIDPEKMGPGDPEDHQNVATGEVDKETGEIKEPPIVANDAQVSLVKNLYAIKVIGNDKAGKAIKKDYETFMADENPLVAKAEELIKLLTPLTDKKK